MARSPRIQGRIVPEVFTQFCAIRDSLALPASQRDSACLAVLLANYTQHTSPQPVVIDHDALMQLLDYAPEEIAEINHALESNRADVWDLLHKGLLTAARTTIRHEQRVADGVPDDPAERKRHRVGSYEHVHEIVTRIMLANDQAAHSLEVLYLSPYMVRKLAQANPHIVNEYFAHHKEEIEGHNQRNGIASERHGLNHNLLRAKYLKCDTDEARVTFVARFGEWFRQNGTRDSVQKEKATEQGEKC